MHKRQWIIMRLHFAGLSIWRASRIQLSLDGRSKDIAYRLLVLEPHVLV